MIRNDGKHAKALQLRSDRSCRTPGLMHQQPKRRIALAKRLYTFAPRYHLALAAEHGEKKTVMIDATYLKAHRTASSLGAKKGGVAA